MRASPATEADVATNDDAANRLRAWLTRRATASLARNGFSLVASSLITSALGMLFWAVAARGFSQAEVGIGAALIAAMTPLASAAQFNFKNVLYRFVSHPGPSSRRLVLRLYLVSAVTAVVLGSGFAALIPWVDPELSDLFSVPWVPFAFAAALAIWTVYGLQEAVLVSLRLSTTMPVKSLIYAVAKLLALFPLAIFLASGGGILAAWVLPALAIGIVTSLVLHRYSAGMDDAPDARVPTGQELLGFLGWDYVGSLASSLSYGMAPTLVIASAGTVAGAHFYLAFSIAYTLYLVGSQISAALMAEHAGQRRHPSTLYADAMLQTMLPVSAAAFGIMVFADPIMAIFGADFVNPGANVLRLLALGAIPWSAVIIYLAICRTRGAVRLVALVQVVNLVAGLGLGVVLSMTLGEVGMALSLLIVQTVLAAVIAIVALRPKGAALGAGVELASATLRATRKLPRPRFLQPAETTRPLDVVIDGKSWVVVSEPSSFSDARVQILRQGNNEAVLKSARSEMGIAALAREYQHLSTLRDDPRATAIHPLLPTVVAFDRQPSGATLLLSRIAGVDARELASSGVDADPILRDVLARLADLHHDTATTSIIGSEWLADWIDAPLTSLAGFADASQLNAIGQNLRQAFAGRQMSLGRNHGDCCLDNIVVSPAGELAGLIDWSESRDAAPLAADAINLVLTLRTRSQERELGHVVLELLRNPELSTRECELSNVLADLTAPQLRSLILLVWLNHVASNLGKSGRYRTSGLWFWANVKLVVESYDHAIV